MHSVMRGGGTSVDQSEKSSYGCKNAFVQDVKNVT